MWHEATDYHRSEAALKTKYMRKQDQGWGETRESVSATYEITNISEKNQMICIFNPQSEEVIRMFIAVLGPTHKMRTRSAGKFTQFQ